MILIASQPFDVHAHDVFTTLNRHGVPASLFYLSQYPSMAKQSIQISNHDAFSFKHTDAIMPDIEFDRVSCVWMRRGWFTLPHVLDIDARDRNYIFGINRHYSGYFWRNMSVGLKGVKSWVNDPLAASQAENKINQLMLASRMGFQIPDTLITNDKDDTILFQRQIGAPIICKPFYPKLWHEKKVYISYSHMFSSAEEIEAIDAEAFCAQPVILQRYIPKSYEIRYTVFGEHHTCVKILSQESESGKIDWRQSGPTDLKIELIEPHKNLRKFVLSYMKALGIEFACFDFIVDSDGEYFFLEVNQAGQFLWIEAEIPETRLLQKFCNFLIEKAELPGFQVEATLQNPGQSDAHTDLRSTDQKCVDIEMYTR